ncbi:class I tRNA ligase family protein, partial [bacterium]|nr:class I tRNA ligase family protein [bacterium]
NTAISQLMIFCNELINAENQNRDQLKTFVLLLSPFAPHICEDLWQRLGSETSLAYEPWPRYDDTMLLNETYQIPVQVNGKVRDNITIPNDSEQDQVFLMAKASSRVQKYIDGKKVIKVVFIQNKIINIVAR